MTALVPADIPPLASMPIRLPTGLGQIVARPDSVGTSMDELTDLAAGKIDRARRDAIRDNLIAAANHLLTADPAGRA